MSGSLRSVLGAIEDGARSTTEIAARTGLAPRTVSDAVENLVQMGRLEPSTVAVGCSSGGCGGCPVASTTGGCGTGRGLVTLRLAHRACA